MLKRCELASIATLAVLAVLAAVDAAHVNEQKRLILVLVNGFAYRWLDEHYRFNLSGFNTLRKHGVRASYLKPEFPTLSLPNQYSLLTGLNVENHGISGDIMYDAGSKSYFINATQKSDLHLKWWNRTEPVWVTASTQRIPTALYWWRGCQVAFQPSNRVECVPFVDSPTTDSLTDRIAKIVDDLSSGHLAFVLINYEMVDLVAHRNGFHSHELQTYVRRIAASLQRLQDSLTEANLWCSTNLMVVSDHGQLPVHLSWQAQYVDDFLSNPSLIEASANDGAFMLLYMHPDRKYQVYKELYGKIPNVSVYLNSDLGTKPDWYYGSASHLSPLILVADPTHGIYRRNRFYSQHEFPLTLHGYDNLVPEMRGIFLARGPDFRVNKRVRWLRMVDVYQIICRVLSLKYCHAHNGTWDNVEDMFKTAPLDKRYCSSSASTTSIQFHQSIAVMLTAIYGILLLLRNRNTGACFATC